MELKFCSHLFYIQFQAYQTFQPSSGEFLEGVFCPFCIFFIHIVVEKTIWLDM